MTTLSPRLAHLLIHEDRSTGKLVLPNGTKVRDTREGRTDRSPLISPSTSPTPTPFNPSPLEKTSALPPMLPAPRSREDRRPSQSIFSLLNDARPVSPNTLPPGPRTAPILRKSPSFSPPSQHRPPPSSQGYMYHPPPTAPAYPSSFDNRGQYLREQQQYQHRASTSALLTPSRPDMFRRHSGHPYDQPSSSRFSTSYIPENRQLEDVDMEPMGVGRAPISRTTKACNACRSRKVRCDAGGASNGEPSTCGRCRESGVACVYSGPQKKRGPCPGQVVQTQIIRPILTNLVPSVKSMAIVLEDLPTGPPSLPSLRPISPLLPAKMITANGQPDHHMAFLRRTNLRCQKRPRPCSRRIRYRFSPGPVCSPQWRSSNRKSSSRRITR